MYIGTLNDPPNRTGGPNPFTYTMNWSIYRDSATARQMFFRLKTSGGVNVIPLFYDLGTILLTAFQTHSGSTDVDFQVENAPAWIAVTIELECSTDMNFIAGTVDTITSQTFQWTSPGLPV